MKRDFKNEQDLLDLKKNIVESKSKSDELKGRKKELMITLKKKFGCDSIADANRHIQYLENKISDIEKKKKKGIQELEEKYDL